MDELQAFSPFLEVRWRPQTEGVTGEGECILNTEMLQLQAGRRIECIKLLGLQARERRDATKEVVESTQD
jgi:hypothetical protein